MSWRLCGAASPKLVFGVIQQSPNMETQLSYCVSLSLLRFCYWQPSRLGWEAWEALAPLPLVQLADLRLHLHQEDLALVLKPRMNSL